VRKGHRRVNTVQILCKHVCKWKHDTYCNWSGKRGRGGQRRMVEGMNSSMTNLIYCKNFCKCHNVPSPRTIKKIIVLITVRNFKIVQPNIDKSL
jgi:hypothetical protein